MFLVFVLVKFVVFSCNFEIYLNFHIQFREPHRKFLSDVCAGAAGN